MSKEKQIEEMAKALTAYEKKLCDRLPKDKCLLTSAIHAQVSCDYCKIAEFLVNAGYRKQSEGEWIRRERNPEAMKVFHEMGIGLSMSVNSIYYTCSECDKWGRPPYKYCPNCGAKMKEGAE